ncbi:PRD domain-containing protein [Anaerorhabdus sp.]|jgi:beta-glucoside operon transcriptional antiterminator|uniref:PRD domain-containing protein n=1 Tax=Anaerorhabdus sp. TaxID=1872524 RepID=UPI002FC6AAB4
MRVIKVLNVSVVLVIDSIGKELILLGKGIGFNKKIGDEILPNEIEKVFILKDKEVSRNIIRLAAETDSVYFEIAKATIDKAKKDFNFELMDYIYLALTDHIAFAAKRVKEEINLANFYTQDVKQFNPQEFELGQFAISLLYEKTGIQLPFDEAGNIAFHFINAQQNNSYQKNRKINDVVNSILEIVQYNFQIQYDVESVAFVRFLTHLRLFGQRLISQTQISENTDVLFDTVIQECKSEYECVKKINKYITQSFSGGLSKQEELYLTIHIHRILLEIK